MTPDGSHGDPEEGLRAAVHQKYTEEPMDNFDADRKVTRGYSVISRLIRRQAKVAKTGAKQHAAELVAAFDAELAQNFEADEARWGGVKADLASLTERANAEILRVCREAGVRPEFAPAYSLSWYGRGWNMEQERRAELSSAAQSRSNAMLERATADIEERTVALETELLSGTLEMDRVHELLEAIPKAALALMAAFDPAELDRTLPLPKCYGYEDVRLPGEGDADE
jgi:hypothetical protein